MKTYKKRKEAYYKIKRFVKDRGLVDREQVLYMPNCSKADCREALKDLIADGSIEVKDFNMLKAIK